MDGRDIGTSFPDAELKNSCQLVQLREHKGVMMN
jgi:cytidylate kinase